MPSGTHLSSKVRGLLAVISLAALLLLQGCGDSTQTVQGNRHHVLLITVDTLRPDHLGIYGYERPTSPRIDAFFKDSLRFQRAYATETATSPSVVSFLTGMIPQNHRVRFFYQLIPDETLTLVDHLEEADYQTAGIVSNMVLTDEAIGLGERFDFYDDFVDEKEGERQIWERNARRTTDAALTWLRDYADPDEPMFLWVHYIDPHGPYEPPKDAPKDFTHEEKVPIDVNRVLPYQRIADCTDGQEYIDRYDEEIAYCDREIGRLLDGYAELVSMDRTIVAFTADHGETMIEHEMYFTHQYHTYDSIALVPLMLKGPGVPQGTIEDPVSLVDLPPSLLSLLDLPTPSGLDGASLFEGRDGRDIYIEATDFGGKIQRRALVRNQRKWLVELERPSGKMMGAARYYLDTDQNEERPQPWSNKDQERAAALLTAIRNDPDPAGVPRDFQGGLQLGAPKVRPGVSDEELERLRAIGYVK